MKTDAERSSEESLPERMEKDIEGLPTETVDILQNGKHLPIVTATGDRTLVLMDLENGMVGWESEEDPENPQ